MSLKKADVQTRRDDYAFALTRIADQLPKDSPIRAGIGGVAWGRYKGEPCATDSLVNAAIGYGYLQGIRDALMRAGRDQGWEGTYMLERIHEQIRDRERARIRPIGGAL